MIVGSIGNDLRMDYTAVGDTTNLASRMESMAKPGTIVVSRDTFRIVRDFFEFESLGKVELKGKEEPQEAFTLLKAGEIETRIGASVAKGLTRFVGRKNWTCAENIINNDDYLWSKLSVMLFFKIGVNMLQRHTTTSPSNQLIQMWSDLY